MRGEAKWIFQKIKHIQLTVYNVMGVEDLDVYPVKIRGG